MAPRSPLQLKVTLRGLRPPIWRRLVVAGDATLAQLHFVLQVAMGWEDEHLHAFWIGGARYGPADDPYSEEVDEATVRVGDVLVGPSGRGEYHYDFGDSWVHDLAVEVPKAPLELAALATCIAGKRSCPPEDCGGIWGYANLLDAIADPSHEDHEDRLEWLGEDFDPEFFELAVVNAELEQIPFRSPRN